MAFIGALSNDSTSLTTVTNTYAPTSGNCLTIMGASWFGLGIPTHTLTDTRGNTIPATTTSSTVTPGTGGSRMSIWIIPNCIGGAGTFTLTSSNAGDNSLVVVEDAGLSLTGALDGTPLTPTFTTGTSLASGNFTTTHANSRLLTFCYDQHNAQASITNSLAGGTQYIFDSFAGGGETAECYGIFSVAANTYADTKTLASATNAAHLTILAIQSATVTAFIADGHTAAGTTVATGTGGSALGAVTTAQNIDVLFRASSAAAHTCTCADSLGNVYTQIDHNDSTAAHSLEFYRFLGFITTGGTPTITCTYGASAQLDVAATILSGLIPVPFAAAVNHFQSAASIGAAPATDLQSSTNLPTLSSKPTLLGCWGYCDANGTPTTGTQFTSVGTAWSTLGAGTPRLAYENLNPYNSFVPISGRFTPVPSQDAYTFMAAFNEPALPVTPAGSMPKQIYVMP